MRRTDKTLILSSLFQVHLIYYHSSEKLSHSIWFTALFNNFFFLQLLRTPDVCKFVLSSSFEFSFYFICWPGFSYLILFVPLMCFSSLSGPLLTHYNLSEFVSYKFVYRRSLGINLPSKCALYFYVKRTFTIMNSV